MAKRRVSISQSTCRVATPKPKHLPVDVPSGDPEAEAAVDRGLAGAQRGQCESLGPGTPEVVVHHQPHQATAVVGGTDRDGVDGHDRDDVPAGIHPDRRPGQPGDHLTSLEPWPFRGTGTTFPPAFTRMGAQASPATT